MAISKSIFPYGDWFTDSIKFTNQYLKAGTVTALPATALTHRRKLIVANDSGAAIWVRGVAADLRAATGGGYEIANNEERTFDLDAGVILYAISVAVAWVGCLEFA